MGNSDLARVIVVQSVSRSVISNQDSPHSNLEKVVLKHRSSIFAKPIAEHSIEAFERAQAWLNSRGNRPLIFDSCCGVGQSSRKIASAHPDCDVVGVDKSQHRLQRGEEQQSENLLLLRADLNDFYRLAQGANWKLHKHFILYPNPWPKSVHLGRRWHGAPVFPSMLALGGQLELRSNWKLYLEEFQFALAIYGVDSILAPLKVDEPLTPFEAKYRGSGQALWCLQSV